MSRPLRLEFPGALFFVECRGNNGHDVFRDAVDRRHFLDLLGDAVGRFDWIVTGYVLMSNRVQFIVQLTRKNLSRGLKWLNGSYAQWFNRKYDRVGHLWQARPDTPLIERESYFLELQRDIVLEPVRAKLAADPQSYAWSSYRAIAGDVDVPDWLAVAEVLVNFGRDLRVARERYRRFIAEGIGSSRSPWNDVIGQVYLGTPAWVAKIKKQIDAKLRPSAHPLVQRCPARPTMAEIIAVVADVTRVPEDQIRGPHGGRTRLIAAWLGCYEARLRNTVIAASLQLRSDSTVSKWLRKFDDMLTTNSSMRSCIDACVATLRRKADGVET